MRKRFIIVVLAIVLCLPGLTGCGEITLNHISDSKLETYLEKKYDSEFTLQSKVVTPLSKEDEGDSSKSRTLYIYTDENGIECHIYQTFSYNEAGTRFYDYTEDYQVMYVRSHPEILEELYSGEFIVECETEPTDQKNASSTYWVTLENSDDVEEVVTLIMNVFEEMDPISDTGFECDEGTVKSERPIIRLKHYAYEQNITTQVYYYFPTKQNPFNRSEVTPAITEANEIMSQYVASMHGLLGPGWEEELKNTQKAYIDNVFFQEQRVIRELKYAEEFDCYVVDTREHMVQPCDFYISEISELATSAGFTEEISGDFIRYTKGNRIVEFTRDGYSVDCTINDDLYRYQGYYIWEDDGEYLYRDNMPVALLTEHDLEAMFGISFEIDQIRNRATMQVKEVT